MAGLGVDIEEVYTELGAEVTIVSRDPVVTGEHVLFDINAQATKPFIREHQLDAFLPYNTLIETSDVIKMTAIDRHYMVMNKTPEMFENAVVEWSVVLYLCNLPANACIVRPVEVRNPETYNITSGWQMVASSPIYGLLSERVFGSEVKQQNEVGGQFPIWAIDFIVPKYYGIQSLDRLIISPTEYYKIEVIESYNYPGMALMLLTEDTRDVCTIVDGEIYDD